MGFSIDYIYVPCSLVNYIQKHQFQNLIAFRSLRNITAQLLGKEMNCMRCFPFQQLLYRSNNASHVSELMWDRYIRLTRKVSLQATVENHILTPQQL